MKNRGINELIIIKDVLLNTKGGFSSGTMATGNVKTGEYYVAIWNYGQNTPVTGAADLAWK